jgi:hypothetical protein
MENGKLFSIGEDHCCLRYLATGWPFRHVRIGCPETLATFLVPVIDEIAVPHAQPS